MKKTRSLGCEKMDLSRCLGGGELKVVSLGCLSCGQTWIYIYINNMYKQYIYMVTPPHDPPTSILYGNYQCFMHIFFTRKMTFSCFYFFYLLRKLPTQTHTHMQFCFCLLFCHFLRFWSKTQKTLRKPKKQKKQNCKTHVGTSWWVRVCKFVFFCFFWISRGF